MGISWKSLLAGDKSRRILIALGIAGMALILLSELLPKTAGSPSGKSEMSGEEFTAMLESRLVQVVESIEGAGKCCVMVTLENGVQYVYATEQKSGSNRVEDAGTQSSRLSQQDDREESIIVVDANGNREGLLVTTLEPVVKGVVVICEGGDQTDVQTEVKQAVMTALNITSKRVYVTKLQA